MSDLGSNEFLDAGDFWQTHADTWWDISTVSEQAAFYAELSESAAFMSNLFGN